VKQELAGNDVEAIKSATELLMQASQKLAEIMYAQATAEQDAERSETSEQEPSTQEEESETAEDVTEAEYEVVDEDEKEDK